MKHPQTQQDLASAYRLCAMMNMDDLTYSHISSRASGEDAFYIAPFGMLFEEVTPESLLKVSFTGEILQGSEYQYNLTGYVLHGSLYQSRPDINSAFHLHTIAGVSVSALKNGLLPLSQWALHFYNRVAYHDYSSLLLDYASQTKQLIADLEQKNIMFLRNHGTLTCGKTIQEAFFYSYHLEQACKVQCKLSHIPHTDLIIPSSDVCAKAVEDLLSFESDLGQRDWVALTRKLNRLNVR